MLIRWHGRTTVATVLMTAFSADRPHRHPTGIAKGIVFLVSDAAALTGAGLIIDGGITARSRAVWYRGTGRLADFVPFPSGNHPRCSKGVRIGVSVTSTSGFGRLLLATKAICR